MTRRLTPVLLAALAMLPRPAGAAIRALFVGIDHYLYSRDGLKDPTVEFGDLHGAVADVGHIKRALTTAYGLQLDTPKAGCVSANKVSITLTDTCATRQAIIDALNSLIDASVKGDTIIWYYAGHGSRIADDQTFDQAGPADSTLLSTDARSPDETALVELVDRENRRFIDRASAKGVNVVTIFDSCFSGSGTRAGEIAPDGENRGTPPRRRPLAALPPSAGGSGWRVHLAAAGDDEEAREIGGVGQRAGVFTSALSATLVAMPGATFSDIVAETKRKVEETGHPSQHPRVEGDGQLATLTGGLTRAVILDATSGAAGVTLAAGRLSGMAVGSAFDLYASTTEAVRAGGARLASGHIASVDADRAVLTLDAPPLAPLPPRLAARETAHAFGDLKLLVGIDATSALRKQEIERIVGTLPFATIGDPAQLIVVTRDPIDQKSKLVTADATPVADLPGVSHPDFAGALAQAIGNFARVRALLALRTDPARADASFCIANDLQYDLKRCPAVPAGGRVLALDRAAKLAVVNLSAQPRYIYVLGIDDGGGVSLLIPRNGGVDAAMAPGRPQARDDIAPNSPGRYRFVTIATDAPINAAALEQARAGARDPAGCRSALERALCGAATGSRDPSAPRVGAWTATLTEVMVK